jgi:hypothetical protein
MKPLANPPTVEYSILPEEQQKDLRLFSQTVQRRTGARCSSTSTR